MCTCTRVYELHIRIYYHNIYTYMSTFSQVGCLAPISPSDICQVSAPSPIRVLRPPLCLPLFTITQAIFTFGKPCPAPSKGFRYLPSSKLSLRLASLALSPSKGCLYLPPRKLLSRLASLALRSAKAPVFFYRFSIFELGKYIVLESTAYYIYLYVRII